MPATTGTSRNRNRLPLSPRVTTSRRGGHVAARTAPVVKDEAVIASPAATGVRITPNAIIASRGSVGGGGFAKAIDGLGGERRFAIR